MSWDEAGSLEGRPVGAATTPAGGRVATGLSLLLGTGSILMGYFLAAHFLFLVSYYVFIHDPRAPMGWSWKTMLFHLTHPWWVAGLLWWVGIAWALGYVGRRIVRTRRAPGRRDSLASAAARLCALGLIGCGLDLAILAGALAYRWGRWLYG